jgi:hypothetical protein
MVETFRRSATVQFAINGTDQTVTINDLPYLWIPNAGMCPDQSAIFAARDWARENLQFSGGLNVLMVSTHNLEGKTQ